MVTAAIEFGVPPPSRISALFVSRVSIFARTDFYSFLASHIIVINPTCYNRCFCLFARVPVHQKSPICRICRINSFRKLPFFLYSVTPEVFALLDMFLILLLYELFLYKNNPSLRILSVMALTFGLSLTHHHVILFVLPVLLFSILSIGLPKS